MAMIRKEDNDCYVIGIYMLVRSGRKWECSTEFSGIIRDYSSLSQAYLHLTGERIDGEELRKVIGKA